jgi:hypothetical protein
VCSGPELVSRPMRCPFPVQQPCFGNLLTCKFVRGRKIAEHSLAHHITVPVMELIRDPQC